MTSAIFMNGFVCRHFKFYKFMWFRRSLKPRKIQRNTIFPFIVVCSVWNHKFKNPWINAFCRNHENWCQRIKVLSQYLNIFVLIAEKQQMPNFMICCYPTGDEYWQSTASWTYHKWTWDTF
jgi:hypothetical protein